MPPRQPAEERSWLPWTSRQFAWATYECARNPFYVLINIYVFSAYFASTVVSDPVWGQSLWGYTLSAAAIVVALTAPVLGVIADAGGRRKPFLMGCILVAVPAVACLYFARPAMGEGLTWIVGALVLANIAYELSSIFFNALLPQVASPHRYGSVSGLAYALANMAGIILFSAYLFGANLIGAPEGDHLPERLTPLIVAGWWLVFSLPLLLYVPDAPKTNERFTSMVSNGLARLTGTVRFLKSIPDVLAFIIARMVFNEGFIILMMFMGVIGAGVLGWTAIQLSIMGLALSFVAVAGSLVAGQLDEKIGSKSTLQICIWGCVAANLLLVTISPGTVLFVTTDPDVSGGFYPRAADKAFFFAECLSAFFVTGGLVSSRAMLAKLAPKDALNELFGIYALSGTATSFIGPLCIALLTQAFEDQRVGLSAGLVFLVGGSLLLRRVRNDQSLQA